MNRKRKNRGFTILETLIVVGIFAFIISALYGTLAAGRRSWLTGSALVEAQQQARITMERIINELSHSNHIHVSVAGDNSSVRFDIPQDTDSDGFLDFITGTSSIVFGAEDNANWSIEYQIDAANEQIIRVVFDASDNEIARQIIAQNINPTLSNFQTETGGAGMPQQAVIITITSEIDAVRGAGVLASPIQTTYRSRANMRN